MSEDRRSLHIALLCLALGMLVGAGLLAEQLTEIHARRAVIAAAVSSTAVNVNGKRVPDPSVLLGALRGLGHIPGHHSSPTAPIRVDLLVGVDTTPLVLARDSQRPDEFWVYRPGPNWHNDPLGQDAGRIRSVTLDTFFRDRGF